MTESRSNPSGPAVGYLASARASRRWWDGDAGAGPVALDISQRMLRAAPADLPRVQADAGALPFAAASFDLACSSYGALPFVPDLARVFGEVARVLRPGGRWVFSVSHPVRWAFPDDPGPRGLVADRSYFDRSGYVEYDPDGRVRYVEHHHTLGDYVRALAATGFRILDLVEPPWPDTNRDSWGGWSPLRGAILPGTAIWVCRHSD